MLYNIGARPKYRVHQPQSPPLRCSRTPMPTAVHHQPRLNTCAWGSINYSHKMSFLFTSSPLSSLSPHSPHSSHSRRRKVNNTQHNMAAPLLIRTPEEAGMSTFTFHLNSTQVLISAALITPRLEKTILASGEEIYVLTRPETCFEPELTHICSCTHCISLQRCNCFCPASASRRVCILGPFTQVRQQKGPEYCRRFRGRGTRGKNSAVDIHKMGSTSVAYFPRRSKPSDTMPIPSCRFLPRFAPANSPPSQPPPPSLSLQYHISTD